MTGPLVVIGDTFLDVDLDGSSDRLCPDAPVPVLDLTHRYLRPGGAGLAALLAARAGAPVVLVAPIGTDEAGDTVLELLRDHVEVVALPLAGETVTKTRIGAADLRLVRVDSGDGVARTGQLPDPAVRAVERAGAVLVADYGRGTVANPALRRLLADRPRGTALVWDPHPRGAHPVTGATLVTPNEAEADRAAGASRDTDDRGRRLCARWSTPAVAVTVGERGALLTRAGQPGSVLVPVPDHLRGHPGEQHDTCGAGDRFATAVAEGLRRGDDVAAAVRTAVAEAARYVTGGGAATMSAIRDAGPVLPSGPGPVDAVALAERVHRSGGRVVATGGCFDLLHRGHVNLLQSARALGDVLVVCLNSDASVRRAKGAGRPLVGERDRAGVLAALAAVDAVAVFDEDTPAAVLELIRPDVWVKGTDYADRALPEADVVTRHGGRVVLVPTVPGYSTTALVRSAHSAAAQ